MLLERHISNIEELKFPTINELIIPFFEPYEHVLCHPPTALTALYPNPTCPGPRSSLSIPRGADRGSMGGGRYLLLTDRKHLSFVPPDPKKITIEKVVLAGRVASETSLSEEEASSSGSS